MAAAARNPTPRSRHKHIAGTPWLASLTKTMILGFRETPYLKGIRQREMEDTLQHYSGQYINEYQNAHPSKPYTHTDAPQIHHTNIYNIHIPKEKERRGREGRKEGKGECGKRQTWETSEHRGRNLSPNKKCSLKISFLILYFQCRIPSQVW